MAAEDDGPVDVSGSPCMLQEHVQSSYAGFAEPDEIVALLRDLEHEARADIRLVAHRRRLQSPGPAGVTAAELERRRVRHWLMLRRQLRRFRGRSFRAISENRQPKPQPFREASMALMADRHAAMAARLEEILPRIADDALHAELKHLREDLRKTVGG